jgi:hypothetical protein
MFSEPYLVTHKRAIYLSELGLIKIVGKWYYGSREKNG